jgi:uncharacterized protein YlxW (UPF0749 family)
MPETGTRAGSAADGTTTSGLRRMGQALRTPRRGQAVVGVLLALVGFGAVTTVRANVDDATYSGYRQQDLIDLLSGLAGTSQRAQDQLDKLDRTRQQLLNATSQRQAAVNQAQEQLSTLQVLAGTVPVTGPGITVTITQVTEYVNVDHFLDLIEELRSNGAEALEVNGHRIVAQTSFDQTTGHILTLDGERLTAPYVLRAIGEPTTLAAAITFTRGPEYELSQDGARVDIVQSQSLTIHSTVEPGGTGSSGSPSGSASPSGSPGAGGSAASRATTGVAGQ